MKLSGYFLCWTLYSYVIHYIAHCNFKYNFVQTCHKVHHAYNYGTKRTPLLADYFFWFGSWRGSLDVWITFTLPLILLVFIDFECGVILLVFHYFYEIFLSKSVLDHNPKIKGALTNFIPIGVFHLKHHINAKCNYSFYLTVWDYLFQTNDEKILTKRQKLGLVNKLNNVIDTDFSAQSLTNSEQR